MFLLRHGQSEFNAHFSRTGKDPGIPDPHLTRLGRTQARAAGRALAAQGVRHIIVSPYTRTLQTAAEVVSLLNVPQRVDPLVRERYAYACDVGSPRAHLRNAWPHHDFAAVDEIWWPAAFEQEPAVRARAQAFATAMRADGQAAATLLVSHWGFLLALTGRSLENGEWIEWNPADLPPKERLWD